MTIQKDESIVTSLLFQQVAKQYLELSKHEYSSGTKSFLNVMINRLGANINDCYTRIEKKENSDLFHREFSQRDMLLYANVFMVLLDSSPKERETIERFIEAIRKGEAVEVVQ